MEGLIPRISQLEKGAFIELTGISLSNIRPDCSLHLLVLLHIDIFSSPGLLGEVHPVSPIYITVCLKSIGASNMEEREF